MEVNILASLFTIFKYYIYNGVRKALFIYIYKYRAFHNVLRDYNHLQQEN